MHFVSSERLHLLAKAPPPPPQQWLWHWLRACRRIMHACHVCTRCFYEHRAAIAAIAPERVIMACDCIGCSRRVACCCPPCTAS